MNTALRFTAGALVGAAAAVVIPRGEDSGRPELPLDLPPSSRAAVVTGSELAPWGLAVLGAGTGLVAAKAVGTRRPGDALGTAILAALTLALRRVEVIVSTRGVTLRSGLPILRGTIPLSALSCARAVSVTAAEFTGLGVRWSPERGLGIILRSGEALRLETARGPLTITADDPQRAAALVAHLKARA